ncbi:T9SS type A sorting domain-containing protein [Fodinibius halophilus]|uniref:T9SS type A sorting domain-containing protein n=1 Tax=Fodinibius halophilus TaxID=1736908 RepID=A0A6M1TL08_9BACT|nr:T9SS type A sorting domain-containing protein [Fodinibius halophilus]NGP89160.1 T9SS type A sorting domain-containing protein [Fodinibius halophilus]
MRRIVILFIAYFVIAATADAQQGHNIEEKKPMVRKHISTTDVEADAKEMVHGVPFGSSGNEVRMKVKNSSSETVAGLEIEVKDVPKWMTFTSPSAIIGDLKGGKKATASFSFEIDKEAPVQEKVTLRFVAKNKDSYSWGKEISLSVEAPTELKLNQNYPNPFNPTTTINYELPVQMDVTVQIYNILGQRVITLVNEIQEAGSQTVKWNASRFASGMYFYRIIADAPSKKKIIEDKKMMLIK